MNETEVEQSKALKAELVAKIAELEAEIKENAAKHEAERKENAAKHEAERKENAAKHEAERKEEAAKITELEAERKENAAEIAELEAQWAKIEALRKEGSIAKFIEENRELAISHCQPSIPPDNETAREAWEAFDRSQKRGAGQRGGHKSKRKRGEEETNDEETDDEETKKPDFHRPIPFHVKRYFGNYLDFPFKHQDEKGNYSPCSILMKAHVLHCRRPILPVQNERTLQGYLECVKNDTFCAYQAKAQVNRERSLFSLWPDVTVTRTTKGSLLYMDDVKIPSSERGHFLDPDKVFLSESAIGQAHSYNVAQKQAGNDFPLTILSTYRGTVIVTLPGCDDKYEEILREALDNLKNKKMEPDQAQIDTRHEMAGELHPMGDSNIPDKESKDRQPTSPVKKGVVKYLADIKTKARVQENVGTDDEDEEIDISNTENSARNTDTAIISEVFDSRCLYPLVALVSAASFVALRGATKQVLVPKEGDDTFGNKNLFMLYKQSFEITKTKSSFKPTYNKAPQFKGRYHLFCTVGERQEGKCILLSSTGGQMFVAKLFLVPWPYNENFQEKEKEARDEKKRWHTLFPKFKSWCKKLLLNNTPALTMPFFSPIPMKERKSALEKIEQCLIQIAAQRKDLDNEGGTLADNEFYFYEEICWGHFGCRYNEEQIVIYPLDLRSLRKRKGDSKQKIKDALLTLKENMGSEEESSAYHPIVVPV